MLAVLSKKLASYFFSNEIIDDTEIYAYGLELLLASILEVAVILVAGLVFRRFWETIAFFVAFIPLRTYAGGYHANTHLRCFGVLVVDYAIVLGILHFLPIEVVVPLTISSSVITFSLVLLFAPVDDSNKELSNKEKEKYRLISLWIVLFEVIVTVPFIIFEFSTHILLGFALGQLSASLSLLAAKIKLLSQK